MQPSQATGKMITRTIATRVLLPLFILALISLPILQRYSTFLQNEDKTKPSEGRREFYEDKREFYQNRDSGGSTRDLDEDRRDFILLVTSPRSGSSFSSAIIAKHPQVFYFFEPLFQLMMFQMPPNPVRTHWDANYTFDETVPILDSYFKCTPNNASIFDSLQNKKSVDTKRVHKCLMIQDNGYEHLHCYFRMVRACLRRKATLIKVVRFRLKWSEFFLKKYPNMKIVFLIRDPRAVLYSQGKNLEHFNFTTESGSRAKDHCADLREDLQDFRRLSAIYPDKIKAFRYEDGAMKPQVYAQRLYNFLGFRYTHQVASFVTSLAFPQLSWDQQERPFNVYRKNAIKTMNKWRYKGGYGPVSAVEGFCKDLYPALGYKALTGQDHLESEESLVTEPDHEANIF